MEYAEKRPLGGVKTTPRNLYTVSWFNENVLSLPKEGESPKYDYLYELDDKTEVAVLDYDDNDIWTVDGYPVESLESQLKWMLEQNRLKDKEKIRIIEEFLGKKWFITNT